MHSVMNYEGDLDSFNAIKNLKSSLKYGDKENIQNPWITVFIPTFNRVKLLEQSINSVLKQEHCDFEWDLIVVDNEEDDGKVNETERLIRQINSPRILYYRNSFHVRPGDNFNNGLMLARGEWVCFLHDDDILISDSLRRIGNLIKELKDYNRKPLGAISAKYHQFTYVPESDKSLENLAWLDEFYKNQPLYYGLYRLTHANIWFTANIGGDVPSNGTTYNRKAALNSGGFNEDFGISGDLILFYRMENKYSVYASAQPLGLYRWGSNTMIKPESTKRVIRDGYDFREYVYHKNMFTRIMGCALRRCHTKQFESEVIEAKNKSLDKKKRIRIEDFQTKECKPPTRIGYVFYRLVWQNSYYRHKRRQCIRLHKQISSEMKLRAIKKDMFT